MTPATPEFVQVPPRDLTTTKNVRTDLRLDKAFLASIKRHGVLVPIVATRGEDGALAIAYGHRRAAAAAQLGLASVPVMVVADPGEATRLAAQIVENERRASLTLADQVAAHEQLAALGVPLAQAARDTGASSGEVRAMRRLGGTAPERLEQLDLPTALVIDEFDDEETRAQLLEVFESRGRDQMLRDAQMLRDEAELAAAVAAEADAWRARGYKVAADDRPNDLGWVPLYQLRPTADGGRLEPEDHADCPGRAVSIRGWRPESLTVTEHCTDPTANGHVLPGWMVGRKAAESQGAPDPAVADALRRKERAEVIANNKAWRAAEPVRRQHVGEWLARAKPTPAIARWIAGELLGTGLGPQRADVGLGLRDDLLWAGDVLQNVKAHKPSSPLLDMGRLTVNPDASQPRAVAAILAIVLAARELDTSTDSWRSPMKGGPTARYFDFLAEHTGYRLGDVERLAAGQQPGADQESQEAQDGQEARHADPLAGGDPAADPLAEPMEHADAQTPSMGRG